MSSVTRFIKQVPLSTTYYSVPSSMIVGGAIGTGVYEFVPSATNTVGNYAPGYMAAASAEMVAALTVSGTVATLVLRDMGKGVKTRIPVNVGDVKKGTVPDLVLRSGDIVIVPEKFFSF